MCSVCVCAFFIHWFRFTSGFLFDFTFLVDGSTSPSSSLSGIFCWHCSILFDIVGGAAGVIPLPQSLVDIPLPPLLLLSLLIHSIRGICCFLPNVKTIHSIYKHFPMYRLRSSSGSRTKNSTLNPLKLDGKLHWAYSVQKQTSARACVFCASIQCTLFAFIDVSDCTTCC